MGGANRIAHDPNQTAGIDTGRSVELTEGEILPVSGSVELTEAEIAVSGGGRIEFEYKPQKEDETLG